MKNANIFGTIGYCGFRGSTGSYNSLKPRGIRPIFTFVPTDSLNPVDRLNRVERVGPLCPVALTFPMALLAQ